MSYQLEYCDRCGGKHAQKVPPDTYRGIPVKVLPCMVTDEFKVVTADKVPEYDDAPRKVYMATKLDVSSLNLNAADDLEYALEIANALFAFFAAKAAREGKSAQEVMVETLAARDQTDLDIDAFLARLGAVASPATLPPIDSGEL